MTENSTPPTPQLEELIAWTDRFNQESAQRLTPEARQLADLAAAYAHMSTLVADSDSVFGEATFRLMHSLLAPNIPHTEPGVYFTGPRRIKLNPSWDFVPFVQGQDKVYEMQKLGEDYSGYMIPGEAAPNASPDVVRQAADVITRVCHIHPFFDGNGRLSRVMADSVFLRKGLHQIPFWANPRLGAEKRKEYAHKMIIGAVKGNPEMLLEFLAKEQILACRDEAQALWNDPETKGLKSAREEIARQENYVSILSGYVDQLRA